MKKIIFFLIIIAYTPTLVGQEILSYTTGADASIDIKAIPGSSTAGSSQLVLNKNRIHNRSMIEWDRTCSTNTNSPVNMWTFGMDGDDILRLSRYNFNSQNGHSSIDALLFSVDAGNSSFVTIPSHAKLRFGSETVGSSIQGNGIELIIDAFVLTPITDNVTNLGSSSNRFKVVYTVNGIKITSDSRLKRNIKKLPYGLEEVLKLKPVEFSWKGSDDPIKEIGLIAQEVLVVIPEAVITKESVTQEDGITLEKEVSSYGIQYHFLIPVLIQAIKEQNIEINRLRKEASAIISSANVDSH